MLDNVRKYCELIDKKGHHTCVDKNDIITGGIAFFIDLQSLHIPLQFYIIINCIR